MRMNIEPHSLFAAGDDKLGMFRRRRCVVSDEDRCDPIKALKGRPGQVRGTGLGCDFDSPSPPM